MFIILIVAIISLILSAVALYYSLRKKPSESFISMMPTSGPNCCNSPCAGSIDQLRACSEFPIQQNAVFAFPTSVQGEDLSIYIPEFCDKNDHPNNEHVNYFTIVSKKFKQPIFSIWSAPRGGTKQGKRADEQFRPCCATGVTTKDYMDTGFDRGHQVASEDMAYLDCSGESCSSTSFSMCNISPQNHALNAPPHWAALEEGTHQCIDQNDIIVYTGPMFLDLGSSTQPPLICMDQGVCSKEGSVKCNDLMNPKGKNWYQDSSKYQTCLGNNIPVPDAFYKVIVTQDRTAYPIIMNQQTPRSSPPNTSIRSIGQKAWTVIKKFLSDNGITLPTFTISDDNYRDAWVDGKCPI